MKRLTYTFFTVLFTLVGCGSEEQAAVPPAANVQPAQVVAQAQPQPTPGAALSSNFGTVSLTAGFVPDPHVVTGTSGGSRDASSLGAGCTGWISDTPDHILAAGGSFSSLRVLAHSTSDITLVIQKPDGSYLCNDDSEGTDPIVEAAMAAGNYKIWVGSYQQGASSAYRLGFSELASATAASL